MIENLKQLQITRSWIAKFKAALEETEKLTPTTHDASISKEVHIAALKAQLEALEGEVTEFINKNLALLADTKRHTGRTTRIIDLAIQNLFNFGTTEVKDHYTDDSGPHVPDVMVIKRLIDSNLHKIVMRLQMEHGLYQNVDYTYDKKTNLLKLINHVR